MEGGRPEIHAFDLFLKTPRPPYAHAQNAAEHLITHTIMGS